MPQVDFRLAELDVRKLSDYCLDPSHPLGRHKARVFRAALGLDAEDAKWLRAQILDRVGTAGVEAIGSDRFGTRYRADLPIGRHGRQAMVRTIWIVADGSLSPRFVTCWII